MRLRFGFMRSAAATSRVMRMRCCSGVSEEGGRLLSLVMFVSALLTRKQRERANKRKHAHAKSKGAGGLCQNVGVVDHHGTEQDGRHDGKCYQDWHMRLRVSRFMPMTSFPRQPVEHSACASEDAR